MSQGPAWYVIVNPAAGGGRAARGWPRLQAALAAAGVAHRVARTAAPGHAQELVRAALGAGHRHFLALGGDGALHELVNGLMDAGAGDAIVAAAPLGTGNDWAAHLGVPRDPARLAACLRDARSRRVDLGRVVCEGFDGQPRRAWFHNVCGAGLDAEVLARTPAGGPRRLAYLVGLARTLGGFRPPRFAVEADGQRHAGAAFLALGALGPRCGGGMRLAPAAVIDDGWLDAAVIDALPLWQVPARLPKLFNGRLAGDPALWTRRCRQLQVAAEPPARIEADGQLIGRTPMTLEVVPGALAALDCAGLSGSA